MTNYKIKGSDQISPMFQIIYIIFQDKCIQLFIHPEYNGTTPTFDKVVEIATEHGYCGAGRIIVIAESGLQGEVYQYNNYNENEWVHHGETRGYA